MDRRSAATASSRCHRCSNPAPSRRSCSSRFLHRGEKSIDGGAIRVSVGGVKFAARKPCPGCLAKRGVRSDRGKGTTSLRSVIPRIRGVSSALRAVGPHSRAVATRHPDILTNSRFHDLFRTRAQPRPRRSRRRQRLRDSHPHPGPGHSPILAGRDLLGGSQTGTGKTAAFTLPVLQRLAADKARSRAPRCLVLTPTRELAAQVADSVATYGKGLHLSSAVIFGGVGMNPQIDRLRRGVDILVATPGRLLDHAGQARSTFPRSASSSSTRPTACSTWVSSTTSAGS